MSRSLRSLANYTLHTEHAYCLSYRFLNNVVITTVIEMVEMVEILDGRLGKRSVERVRYVINNLLHLVIVKYGTTVIEMVEMVEKLDGRPVLPTIRIYPDLSRSS